MSIITLKDDAVTGAERRHATVTGFADLAVFLETRLPLWEPTALLNIPVPKGTRPERLAALDDIAREWGTEVTDGPGGMRIAVRKFGEVTVEAHVGPDETLTEFFARADARKARQGSPVAA